MLAQLDDRIMSFSLTDNRGFDADQLSISIDDSGGLVALPPRGAELAVSIGWLGEPLIYKGLYTVDEVSHEGPADTIGITA
ncbi:phage late control D family protein, partial [Escherichia coli]|nr:phage late control D family protein [Escherichia coli]